MTHLSMLGDNSTIGCAFLVSWRLVVRLGLGLWLWLWYYFSLLGLGLEFIVLFFRVRVRVRIMIRIRVIITWYAHVLYEKSHYFTYFYLSNLTSCSKYNISCKNGSYVVCVLYFFLTLKVWGCHPRLARHNY